MPDFGPGFAIADLAGLGFAFALVLARVAGAVAMLPGLGEAGPPATVRAGLAAALTAVLLPALLPLLPPAPDQPILLGVLVLAEALRGLLLGWMARVVTLSLVMAGSILSTLIGLSSILQPDPALGQIPALGRLLAMAAPVLLFATGLHAPLLRLLAESWQVVPAGLPAPGALADGLAVALTVTADATATALRLAAPFVIAGLALQAVLGLLSRLMPQLQVFSLATPGQIVGGLLLLAVLAAPMLAEWVQAVAAGFGALPGG